MGSRGKRVSGASYSRVVGGTGIQILSKRLFGWTIDSKCKQNGFKRRFVTIRSTVHAVGVKKKKKKESLVDLLASYLHFSRFLSFFFCFIVIFFCFVVIIIIFCYYFFSFLNFLVLNMLMSPPCGKES